MYNSSLINPKVSMSAATKYRLAREIEARRENERARKRASERDIAVLG